MVVQIDLCVEFEGIKVWVKDMENLERLLRFLKERGIDAKIHRLHFREDLGTFCDEILTLEEALAEIEEIGTDLTVV